MDYLIVLQFGTSERLKKMIVSSVKNYEHTIISDVENMNNLKNKKILFAIDIGSTGINIEYMRMLQKICSDNNYMQNSIGGVIINSENELFTRSIARKTIFYANMAGCMFPGKPLSEATGSLKNFSTQYNIFEGSISMEDILLSECKKVADRVMNTSIRKMQNSKILVLYSGNYKTSNTYALWKMVKENLNGFQIDEIHIENGSVVDCKGCSYKACKHYSQSTNCFYGGIMVEEVYPAILNCHILMMLCPNYNDSINANMSALINRLTALYRKIKFYDKYFYSIIVSGFSGSELVAKQLISALNINKTFMLPPNFVLMETANNPGDVEKIENIESKARKFAENIKNAFI